MAEIRWQFYTRSVDAWDAMYEACQVAHESIDLEQFVFELDEVGKKFLQLFLQKAHEGVAVRMLVDMAGSFGLWDYISPEELAKRGVELRFYNVIRPWRVGRWISRYFRDHRKILIVDGETGFTGGLGMNARMESWRDTQVKVTGRVVSEMRYAFERLWETAGAGRFLRFKRPSLEEGGFSFLTNSPRYGQRFLYHRLRGSLLTATKNIFIATPYFVPNGKMFRALHAAARRGVDVRVMTALTSDHAVVDAAAHSYFAPLLRVGGTILLYQPSMLHAKTVIVDDRIAYMGSMNFDNLSFSFNQEADVVSTNPRFVRQLREQFVADEDDCEEVVRKLWRKRPFREKFLEWLVRPIRRFL